MQSEEVLERLPFGVIVLDSDGVVRRANATARRMLPSLADLREGVGCSRLLGCRERTGPCEAVCLAARAVAKDEALPEIRIDAEVEGTTMAIWVTAAPLSDTGYTVLHLRPGRPGDRRRRTEPHWIAGPHLSVRTLGPTRLETPEGPLDGRWLQQRPGHLLKYLLAERRRRVRAEEVAEAMWPGSLSGITSVRYHICCLRDHLEPARTKRSPSSFILGGDGSYEINHALVHVDADEFESAIQTGLAEADFGKDAERARATLERALSLYEGEFLEEDRYAEWAYVERDRLHDLASKGLRGLVRLAVEAGDLSAAARHLEDLGKLEPFDSTVERELISIWLQQGRRSAASRRYDIFRNRMLKEFGVAPPFTLAGLIRRTDGVDAQGQLPASAAIRDW